MIGRNKLLHAQSNNPGITIAEKPASIDDAIKEAASILTNAKFHLYTA